MRADTAGRPKGDTVRAVEPRISLITLGVTDLERSIRFYRDGLGLPQRDGPEGIAFFETSGTWLSLYGRDALAADASVSAEGSGFRGFSLAHNVGSPDEVNRLLQQAVDAGAVLLKPGQDVKWGFQATSQTKPSGSAKYPE